MYKRIICVIFILICMAVPVYGAGPDNAEVITEETAENEEVTVTHGKVELSASVLPSESAESSSSMIRGAVIASIAVLAIVFSAVVCSRYLKRSREKREAAIRSARRHDELRPMQDEFIKKYTIDNDE